MRASYVLSSFVRYCDSLVPSPIATTRDSARRRIERAGVSDLAGPEGAPQHRDDVVARRTDGLVDDEDAAGFHGGEQSSPNLADAVSSMVVRWRSPSATTFRFFVARKVLDGAGLTREELGRKYGITPSEVPQRL